jgi:hypothetical protein
MDRLSEYAKALVLAGFTVKAEIMSGDYQGRWLALVEYGGRRGYVMDWFGSCAVCDRLEAALQDVRLSDVEATKEAMRELGLGYVDDILTFEEVMRDVGTSVEWDVDSQRLAEWAKNNRA